MVILYQETYHARDGELFCKYQHCNNCKPAFPDGTRFYCHFINMDECDVNTCDCDGIFA